MQTLCFMLCVWSMPNTTPYPCKHKWSNAMHVNRSHWQSCQCSTLAYYKGPRSYQVITMSPNIPVVYVCFIKVMSACQVPRRSNIQAAHPEVVFTEKLCSFNRSTSERYHLLIPKLQQTKMGHSELQFLGSCPRFPQIPPKWRLRQSAANEITQLELSWEPLLSQFWEHLKNQEWFW